MDETNSAQDPKSLATAYLRYARLLRTDDDSDEAWSPGPDDAAYTTVNKTIRDGPPARAWELVVEILKQVPDEDFGTEASGSLEDFVRVHGSAMIEQIEREAERDERFRDALGFVWLFVGDLPGDILERVVRASGGAIKPADGSKRRGR